MREVIPREQTDRVIRALDGELKEGEMGALQFEFDAQGNENALAFTFAFDSSKASFVDAELGGSPQGARLLVNSNKAEAGRIGIAIALPTGQRFIAGRQRLLTLRFMPAGRGVTTGMQVGFDDSVISREVVSADATPLSLAFRGANVTFGERKPRRIRPVERGK